MKMEQTECSEKSAYKIQTPGNHPEENIQRVAFYFRLVNDTETVSRRMVLFYPQDTIGMVHCLRPFICGSMRQFKMYIYVCVILWK
jgi:hypothetical protein